jgi:hypothetical protein
MQQFRVLAIAVLVAASSLVSQAQKQASCTFNCFQLPSDQANGVTDKGTVVGQANFASGPSKGFIHYSGGTAAYYGVPNAAETYFTDRNEHAISNGNYSTNTAPTLAKGFMLNGKVFTSIVEPKAVIGTNVQGINKWNTIVGWYLDSGENQHGFKRSNNGSFVTLDFPGATTTVPSGINDNGMIVGGWWNPRSFVGGGFVHYNGKWLSVEYPGKLSETTQLFGISDAGVMIGTNTEDDPPTAFLYENGVFKVIAVPKSFVTVARGISPDGLITGSVVYSDNSSSMFTARCK